MISKGRKFAREATTGKVWEMLDSIEKEVNGKMDSLYDMANWQRRKKMTVKETQDQPLWRILSHNLIKRSKQRNFSQLRNLKS